MFFLLSFGFHHKKLLCHDFHHAVFLSKHIQDSPPRAEHVPPTDDQLRQALGPWMNRF